MLCSYSQFYCITCLDGEQLVEWYHSVYDKARKIEGAAQRVPDTIKFSRIMESLEQV